MLRMSLGDRSVRVWSRAFVSYGPRARLRGVSLGCRGEANPHHGVGTQVAARPEPDLPGHMRKRGRGLAPGP